jgi:hypothetical protein
MYKVVIRKGLNIDIEEVDVTSEELHQRKFRFNETFMGMNFFL